jgi:hypothetical protein
MSASWPPESWRTEHAAIDRQQRRQTTSVLPIFGQSGHLINSRLAQTDGSRAADGR